MATIRKRNPQDATLRNVRAQKKRLDKLEVQVRLLFALVNLLASSLAISMEPGQRHRKMAAIARTSRRERRR